MMFSEVGQITDEVFTFLVIFFSQEINLHLQDLARSQVFLIESQLFDKRKYFPVNIYDNIAVPVTTR